MTSVYIKKVFLSEGRNLVHTSVQTQMTRPGSAGTNVPGGHNQRVLLCASGGSKFESSRGQCGAIQRVSMATVVNRHGVCGGMCTAIPTTEKKN